MDYIKYITDGIKAICIHHKRRTAGSESVRTAEAEIAESMKDCVEVHYISGPQPPSILLHF